MSNDHKAQALVDRCPYMFEQPQMLNLYAGWLDPLETLCACIHARLHGSAMSFQFLQIKEKFGTCRIYFHLGLPRSEPEAEARLRELAILREAVESDIETAQTACGSRCMVCGRDSTTRVHGAALATLFERHGLSERLRDPWSLAKLPITNGAQP
ncbi:hypothetical protein [Pseudorhodoferax sp. Leaf265]|uniref:hypothetical protein n=1 Tax=Pseudorhodoferax sp. Leaf265 TaxID=1736315 RepID=UPI0012E71890|nr:hypothetical protein [Pseudorhodoferax sp. Leaf265]